MLGTIDPEVLKRFTQAVPEGMQLMVCKPERPGLWVLVKDFLWNSDFRHGMAAVNTMLEALGRNLLKVDPKDRRAATAGSDEAVQKPRANPGFASKQN